MGGGLGTRAGLSQRCIYVKNLLLANTIFLVLGSLFSIFLLIIIKFYFKGVGGSFFASVGRLILDDYANKWRERSVLRKWWGGGGGGAEGGRGRGMGEEVRSEGAGQGAVSCRRGL